jgi:hypothetical protein
MTSERKERLKEMLILGYGFVIMAYVHTIDFRSFSQFSGNKFEDCKVYHVNAPKHLRCLK